MGTSSPASGALTRLARRAWFPLTTRLLGLAVFATVLTVLSLGSLTLFGITITSKAAMTLIWVLWWPALYVSLFFVSRLWCGFLCPLSLVTELGNKMARGRPFNPRRWAWLPFALFFVVVFAEQATGLFVSVKVTLVFFAFAILAAFAIGILFRRFTFCKSFCPLGTLMGTFGRLSLIGLRTDESICKTCPKKSCILGGRTAPCPMSNYVPALKSNKECLLCAKCIKNCDLRSPRIGLVSPGEEIRAGIGLSRAESWFIFSLLGLAVILTSQGTGLVRQLTLPTGLVGNTLRLADFTVALTLAALLWWLVSMLSARWGQDDTLLALTRSGYYYLPLTALIFTFTIVFGFLGPSLGLTPGWVSVVKALLLLVGASWSVAMVLQTPLPAGRAARAKGVHLLTITGIAVLWMVLIFSTGAQSSTFLSTGEVIHIKSYSMGFDPATIVVSPGEVTLEVENLDVYHSFDLDEFGVHELLAPGETKTITFTATPGTYTFYCGVPGHLEAGMKGTLIVKEESDPEDESF